MASPNVVSDKVNIMMSKWKFIDHLSGGRDDIIANGNTYLPQGASEEDKSFENRLKHTKYTDLYNPTIKGINGLIFQKPIEYEDLNPKLEPFIENSNKTGVHFDLSLSKSMKQSLRYGITYVLMDIDKAGESLSDDNTPYMVHIHPSNVINWKMENGKLIQVTIREFIEEDLNEFETQIIEQYRVLRIGEYYIYRTDKTNKNTIDVYESDFTGLDYIPLFNLNLDDENEYMEATPPFYNMGWSCIDLYQLESDSKNSFHIASVPMFSATGVQAEEMNKLVISANTALSSNNENAKYGWIDYEAKALKFSKELSSEIKADIAKEGLNTVTGQTQVTATESVIDNIKTQAKLFHWTRKLRDFAEQLLVCAADLKGLDTESVGSVNIDISSIKGKLDAQDLALYSNMVGQGQMSVETMWSMLAKDGRLPVDFDKDVERERIGSDGLLTDDRDT